MKNLDINNLTKADLVRGIIRLTNTTNNLLKSCGNNLEHGCLAESTLRTKKREFLEKQFEQAWEWFYKAVCENYDVIDADIDKQSLDAIKAKSEMNEILDDIPNMNAARIRMNDNIQHNMAEGIDEILLPYVNGVALGLVKVNRFFKRF